MDRNPKKVDAFITRGLMKIKKVSEAAERLKVTRIHRVGVNYRCGFCEKTARI